MKFMNFDKHGSVEIGNGDCIFIAPYEKYISLGGIDLDYDMVSYSADTQKTVINGISAKAEAVFDSIITMTEELHEKQFTEKTAEVAVFFEQKRQEEMAAHEKEESSKIQALSVEDCENVFSAEISYWMNAEAQRRGYDSFAILMTYNMSEVEAWKKDVVVAAKWRDRIWQDAFKLYADFEQGKTDGILPDFAEWMIGEPLPEWED